MVSEAITNAAAPGLESQATPPAAVVSAAPPPEETPPATPVEEAKPEVDFSARFTALAKKDKALTQRERAIKAQEQALTEYTKAKEQARLDPLAFLEAHGLSYDDVTQFVLNDRKLTDAQRLALVEEQLAAEREAKTQAQKDAERADVEATINGHKEAIKDFIISGGDAFELCQSHEAEDLVYEVIEQHWTETGEILPIKSAAEAVEMHLENLAREKVLKLKRFQPKTEPSQTPAATEPPAEQEPRRSAPTTLTNSAVSSAPPPVSSDDRSDLTDEESKRRSAQMLRQMLAK